MNLKANSKKSSDMNQGPMWVLLMRKKTEVENLSLLSLQGYISVHPGLNGDMSAHIQQILIFYINTCVPRFRYLETSLADKDRGSMHGVEHHDDLLSWKKCNNYTHILTLYKYNV
jgi:hypothetical protein